jgi:hypothetical protein
MAGFSQLVKPLVKSLGDQLELSQAVRAPAPRFGKEALYGEVMQAITEPELAAIWADVAPGESFDRALMRWIDKVSPGTEFRHKGTYEDVDITRGGRNPRLSDTPFKMTTPTSGPDRRMIELLRSRGYDPKRNMVGGKSLRYTNEDAEVMGAILNDYGHVLPEDALSMSLRNTLPKGLWVFRGDGLRNPTFNVLGDKVTSSRPASFSVDPLLAHSKGILHAMRLNRRQPGIYNIQNDLNATEPNMLEREVVLGPVSGRVKHQGEFPFPDGGRRPFMISELE